MEEITLSMIMQSIVYGLISKVNCTTYIRWIKDHYDAEDETVKPYIIALTEILSE